MDYKDIIKLLEAGYTRDEIMAMKADETPEEKPTDETPEENRADEKNSPSKDDDFISGIRAELDGLKEVFTGFKNEITALNIMNSSIYQHEESADDIIAKIINPSYKDDKGE